MIGKNLLINKSIYNRNYVKIVLFFLTLFTIFFLYQRRTIYDNLAILVFVNTLILIIFIVSVYKIKYGLYLFIFFIPLFNSLTTILGIRPISILLFLFFSFCLGFIVNYAGKTYEKNWNEIKPGIVFDSEIAKLILIFIIIFTVSCLITIFRYSNFYPFITNNYYNLKVNLDGVGSTSSIYWTIRFFFNYIIGFGLLLIIFNIIDKAKDIIIALVILVSSTLISSGVVFYQYFFNPYFGSFRYWVDSGRFNATFTDPNTLGAYTILLFPIFVVLIIYFRRWYVKLLLCVSFIPFLAMTFFSGSRSALVGICLALLIFLVLGIIKIAKKVKHFPKHKKIIVLIITLILCVVIIFSCFSFLKLDSKIKSIILGTGLIERSMATFEAALHYYKSDGFIESLKSISNYRYIFWGQAIEMAKDYPLSGVGLGSYIIELPNYLFKNGTNFSQVDYTGNYYLQILSELGLPGLILVLFIFYLIIKKVFVYFRKQKYIGKSSVDTWLLIGLFVSFMTMILAQIFGPHTNFTEIQFTFWLIIGLMLTYIKIKDLEVCRRNYILEDNKIGKSKINNIIKTKSINKLDNKVEDGKLKTLYISNKVRFSLKERISLIIIVVIFTTSFFVSSVTTLSINVQQSLYGSENKYGFYHEEVLEGKKLRWASIDASEVIDKDGSIMIIPIQDGSPIVHKIPTFVRIYIDNILVKVVMLERGLWHDVKLNIPNVTRDKFTLTISVSRSWVPKELSINNDTRELGVMVGKIRFLK